MEQVRGMSSVKEEILKRDMRAIARTITGIENRDPAAEQVVRDLFPHTGQALTIGVTGAPGAGKSSLVDRLALHYRQQGHRVGVLAIDPSSPYSGGALLGDRIRMQANAGDDNVFIRSMATRGRMGGISRGTIDAITVLDAAGYDRILVETVGVGQDEVEIVRAADLSIVVLVPGMGDDIQAIKAGIMEIGDIFVINKADREGIERTERELIALLEMSHRADGWEPPIIRTVAIRDIGIDPLIRSIEEFGQRSARPTASLRRREVARQYLMELLGERLLQQFLLASGSESNRERPIPDQLVDAVTSRRLDPHSAIERLFVGSHSGTGAFDRSLQHIGVAVSSLEEALRFWRDGLGLEVGHQELVADQGVKVAMLPIGAARIELLEAVGPDTPVGRFISRRGPGVHHLCVEVADIVDTIDRLRRAGIRLIDEVPRPGAGGSLIAFVHPASTGGVLLELAQPLASVTD